jgi:hypothetical protein
MSRAAIVADVIRTQAHQLKMPALRRSFEELARQAREERWAHEDYLHEVLAVEVASRARVRRQGEPIGGTAVAVATQ